MIISNGKNKETK